MPQQYYIHCSQLRKKSGFTQKTVMETEIFLVNAKIIPHSSKFEIAAYSPERNELKIRVKSKPENNKANLELVKKLSKQLRQTVAIEKGFRNSHKILRINANPKTVFEKFTAPKKP